MANALKCDACNDFFDFNKIIKNKVDLYFETEEHTTCNHKVYHVCPKCMYKIKDVLKENSQENQTL